MNAESRIRCSWCGDHPLYVAYHDEEWGVPLHDDRALFEALILDGAQAGLSWLTILKKREGYRRAFAGFDPEKIASFDEADCERLLGDSGIVRNRAKIRSAIGNAQAMLVIKEEMGSFSEYLWSFVGGETKTNSWKQLSDLPATSPESEAMSKDLKKRGFRFVGPTICYAMMQAVGMVNDHVVDCFRYREVAPTRR